MSSCPILVSDDEKASGGRKGKVKDDEPPLLSIDF